MAIHCRGYKTTFLLYGSSKHISVVVEGMGVVRAKRIVWVDNKSMTTWI